jgi:hypothetical protein
MKYGIPSSQLAQARQRRMDCAPPERAPHGPEWHGNNWLSCTLGHKAARYDRPVLYWRELCAWLRP